MSGQWVVAIIVDSVTNSKLTHPLQIYSDSSYANSLCDQSSFSGSIAYYYNCPIAWTSTKQPIVALSTTEAEYIALTNACQNLLWLKQLLLDIRMRNEPTNSKPVLLGDNRSSHFLTINPSLHRRSKHIDARYYYIRERHSSGNFVTGLLLFW